MSIIFRTLLEIMLVFLSTCNEDIFCCMEYLDFIKQFIASPLLLLQALQVDYLLLHKNFDSIIKETLNMIVIIKEG